MGSKCEDNKDLCESGTVCDPEDNTCSEYSSQRNEYIYIRLLRRSECSQRIYSLQFVEHN